MPIKFIFYGTALTAILADDCLYKELKGKLKISMIPSQVYYMLRLCGNEKQLNRALDWVVEETSETKKTAKEILFDFFKQSFKALTRNPHYYGVFGAGEVIAIRHGFILDLMEQKYNSDFYLNINEFILKSWKERSLVSKISEM